MADQVDRGALRILDVARSVLAELDLETVLDRVLRAAKDLTGARYAALGVLDESRSELARFLTVGIDDEQRRAIGDLPRGRGVLGELIQRPSPLRLSRVGLHPRSWGFPPGHPPMDTFLGVPVLVRGEPWGNLYLTEKEDGADFTQADEQAVTLLAEFAGVAIDHARKYTGASQRRDELERTVAALEATTEITKAVGGEIDLDIVLELVAKRGRALVSARTLLVELLRGDELEVAAAAGEFPPELPGARLPLAETVASAAFRTGRTQRLEEELNRSRFEQHGLGRLGVEGAGGLVVPLVFRNQTYGVLVALDRLEDGPHFGAEDQRLLEAFAASAAAAVATATSVAAEQHRQRLAAAEDERRRWARELHDETLQGMAALRLQLAAARRSGSAEELDRAVAEAIARLEEDVGGLRALITDLRPAALDEFGVGGALETLVQRVERNGLVVELDVDLAYERGRASTRLAPEVEAALYRIVQEALTNVGKHSGVGGAVVRLVEDEASVRVVVRDDGAGFDTSDAGSGFGFVGMRERVELLGGTLRIESAPGSGTTIAAVLPSRRSAAGQADLRSVGG
ncbi:MAG TPA: GAF domain-containing sensor histidine kinase [Gaiellaceae bacterium]|nr:GAF domain-containing sensor histidine kinase [Gaiellaceae bacterium]